MITFVVAGFAGILLSVIYWGLLVVPTIGSSPVFSHTLTRSLLGMLTRLGLIGLAAYSVLHYGLNHLILMMIAFYTTLMLIMITYKGAR